MPHPLKPLLLNTLGALAYLFCLLQWLWTVALFLPLILKSDFMQQFTQPPAAPVPVASQPAEISTLGIVFVAAVAVVMIVLTIYIIIKIPSVVGKTGSKITHKATAMALPVVTNHKKLPQKKRLQITARLLFIIKIILCVIPLGILFFVDDKDAGITRDIAIVIGGVTALFSLTLFGLQAAGAKLLRVDYKQVW